MDQPPAQSPEIAELIRRLESSRKRLGEHALDLRRKLDVPARLKGSISAQPLAWFGGSLGAGLLASTLFRRPRKEKKRRGLIGMLFGLLVTLLKPSLKGFLATELQRRFLNPAPRKIHPGETRFPLSKP